VFFHDVRVPVGNLIGEVNRGWTYITGVLDLERGALTNAGDLRRAPDDLKELARRPVRERHGHLPIADAIVKDAVESGVACCRSHCLTTQLHCRMNIRT
jgi:3-oxocholest-4-en-26-oyl-CoA dehydrogenase alpha subunit